MAILERPDAPPLRAAAVWQAFDSQSLTNGLVTFLFATTGPLAIILAVASGGGLSSAEIASWLFGSYAVGGVLSIGFSIVYRQPLGLGWTIPGTVLLGPALGHLSLAECVGAYYASGLLILLLGLSGLVGRAMRAIPLPIVMGMVAGVFLPLGLGLVRSFEQAWSIALPMLAAFLAVSLRPGLARRLPPVLAALAAGGLAVWAGGGHQAGGAALELAFVRPLLIRPEFSWQAMGELVVPLAITVIAIQNAQGFFVLRNAGYRPPENALTVGCGLGSFAMAAVGSVPACVVGPGNAILNQSGEKDRRWAGGVLFGLLTLLFGLVSPITAGLGLLLPPAFIGMLGALALLPALQQSFVAAFTGGFPLGALVAFLVTVSGVSILNVGAGFWGLVAGLLASALLERDAFARHRGRAAG